MCKVSQLRIPAGGGGVFDEGGDHPRVGLLVVDEAHLITATRREPFDDFERAYASMVGPEIADAEVRRRCSKATVATESRGTHELVAEGNGAASRAALGRAEVGHLLNELLPTHLSVLYTFASHDYLRSAGPGAYDRFVDLVTSILVLATPCGGLEHDPRSRHRLLRLLLAAIIAVLLERAGVGSLPATRTADDLLDGLSDSSATVAGVLGIEHSVANCSPVLGSASMSRFLDLSARCLGAGRRPQTTGLGALANEVIALASAGRGQRQPRDGVRRA